MKCPFCKKTISTTALAKNLRGKVKNNTRSKAHYQLMAKKSAEARRNLRDNAKKSLLSMGKSVVKRNY